jgi:hypothetical protein
MNVDSDALIDTALLNNLRAKTLAQRRDGMNSSGALIRNLQAAADRGELQYVALFSNSINTKKVVEATAQALKDVSRPTSSISHPDRLATAESPTALLFCEMPTASASPAAASASLARWWRQPPSKRPGPPRRSPSEPRPHTPTTSPCPPARPRPFLARPPTQRRRYSYPGRARAPPAAAHKTHAH